MMIQQRRREKHKGKQLALPRKALGNQEFRTLEVSRHEYVKLLNLKGGRWRGGIREALREGRSAATHTQTSKNFDNSWQQCCLLIISVNDRGCVKVRGCVKIRGCAWLSRGYAWLRTTTRGCVDFGFPRQAIRLLFSTENRL